MSIRIHPVTFYGTVNIEYSNIALFVSALIAAMFIAHCFKVCCTAPMGYKIYSVTNNALYPQHCSWVLRLQMPFEDLCTEAIG